MQGRAPGVTERLARACASRSRLTFAAWALTILAAAALVATSLHGLTSSSSVSGRPESRRAAEAVARASMTAPAARTRTFSDVMVVSSTRFRAAEPRFRSFVADLVRRARAAGAVYDARTHLDGDRTLVSRDGRAVLVQIGIDGDADAKNVVPVVQRSSGGDFQVALTGEHTVANDFNTLSQRDLEQGELAFGLPAALLALVLVFASVVAALVPLLTAIVSIVVALGLVAAISLAFGLSIFIVNMLTGMGLALGIDYSLFVISRYREERAAGFAKDRAIAGATASRGALQRRHVRRRAARNADRADEHHAQPGPRRDPRGRRLGRGSAESSSRCSSGCRWTTRCS